MTQSRQISPWIPALLGSAVALLAVLVLRPAPLRASLQTAEGTVTSSGFRIKNALVGFSALGYVTRSNTSRIYVPASDLEAVQIVPSVDGSEFWLELFYTNDDYALLKVDSLTFYRRYENWTTSKVKVYLSGRADIAFPEID